MKSGELVAGRYRLVLPVGAGGFGEVWRCQDETLGRTVALKLIQDSLEDETARARFLDEARITANLAHPHVVAVLDFGLLEGDRPFLVYELVEGGSLASPGPLDPARIRRWGTQLAEALAAAHDVGVLHRDLKPENVLLRGAEDVVLCDFGIARVAGKETRLTAEGLLLGTPAYMAPELWRGEPASPASDQFAWAATLVGVAGGGSVYGSHEVADIVEVTRSGSRLALPAVPALSAAARAVLDRALDPDPAARFPGMRAAGKAWAAAAPAGASDALARPAPATDDADTVHLTLPSGPAPDTLALGPPRASDTRAPRARPGHTPAPLLPRALAALALVGTVVGLFLMRHTPGPASSPHPPAPASPLAATRAAVAEVEETAFDAPGFDEALLNAADRIAEDLDSDEHALAPEEWSWLLGRGHEALRQALSEARRRASEKGNDANTRMAPLRKALGQRLAAARDLADDAVATRRRLHWLSLLLRVPTKAAPADAEALLAALAREPIPQVRLWMRYRAADVVQETSASSCADTLGRLRTLSRPPLPWPRPASWVTYERDLAQALEMVLLLGVFRSLRECPSLLRPEDWRVLDRGLMAVDRGVVAAPGQLEEADDLFELMLRKDKIFDALGPDPHLATRFREIVQGRRAEVRALLTTELPTWIRDLPRELEELARFLGPDAHLGFSEDEAVGGPEDLDLVEAGRRLGEWLDRCERAFLAQTDEVPPEIWPWLTRNLLPAPSRLLRAMKARLVRRRRAGATPGLRPEDEAAWQRVIDRLRATVIEPVVRLRYGSSRPPLLAQLLLAQVGSPLRAGDFAIAAEAAHFEAERPLKTWMLLVLLDTVREIEDADCPRKTRFLQEVEALGLWREDPLARQEGERRILIDGTVLGARCWGDVRPSYWAMMEGALREHVLLLGYDPAWVAHAADRALEEPRVLVAVESGATEAASFVKAVDEVLAEARARLR